ncbi:hypothetical protein C4D60_Mb07t27210 [Musa balbisiana]|uniref:non-specific serine/threonine protein kinase n=1 Tax=Musa balbisiana TaxID=52838 RepID=A0A4S8JKU3_MUSBA|nr:hypothetical protein C4D60_Mb07t27210 [Musa balbisiana]
MGNICVGPRLSKNGFFQSVSATLWRNRTNKDPLPAEHGKATGEGTSAMPAATPSKPVTDAPQPVLIEVTKPSKVPEADANPAPHGNPTDQPKKPTHIRRASSAAGLQADFVLKSKTENLKEIYSLGRKLGQGQFGTTYLCVEKATGKEYACKSILKWKLTTEEDVEDVRREIQIMHHLSGHPNVISIKEAYEDAVAVHVVMELCAGGELFDRIIQKGHYTERKAAELARVIVGVVEACHSMGVMHRDLKPENFLFVNQMEDAPLKTIDFGLSIFFQPGTLLLLLIFVSFVFRYEAPDASFLNVLALEIFDNLIDTSLYRRPLFSFSGEIFTDVVGSPYYVAPEVLKKMYGPAADVWSAGVIIYILLSGVPPFWAETEQGIFEEVLHGSLDFQSDPWPSVSESAKDLVRKMLVRDPRRRLTAHQVLCHPWVQIDGVAPDKPLDSAVLSRLKQFSAMNKLKKMAIRVIAEHLSEDEIAGLKEMFKMIDTDNSGHITFEELKAGLQRVGACLKESEVYALMQAADVDNSGTIDYGEFIAATLHLNKIEREDHLFAAFSYFDKDGSGYITQDELQQACEELGVEAVHLDDMIKEVDQNNDGRVDYNEFVAMMQNGNNGFGKKGMQTTYSMGFREALNLG